ncbi:VPLPA-CTERM sorting domain-containing protein [Paracoccus sp. (in: a-proteobacteria)]|uniref:VPLPA-CTERM sorting domain-containing protein n=1 Tax=Paracoccus sp. TaxID=267 RepID=UPI0026DF23A3|nr:VPLPA-CTERM sorting domain-containing protein [Paracoccus sp. (in: a-proteobacteria)]MDO5648238.1 VPLPA-CTERM sorting domain-containing protein [Paracoccus sp. (in: a-proteobacteria)]
MKFKIFSAVLAAVMMTGSAQASMITFDDVQVRGSSNYVENGFIFDRVQFHKGQCWSVVPNAREGRCGGASGAGVVEMRSLAGDVFGIASLWFRLLKPDTHVTFETDHGTLAYRAGEGDVVRSIGHIVQDRKLQDITFLRMTDHARVMGGLGEVRLDNIRIGPWSEPLPQPAPVPLPASALLLLAGMGALAATRRRSA